MPIATDEPWATVERPTAVPLVLGVVGLPRTGTTVVAAALDSCINAFCMSEPVNWLMHHPGQRYEDHRAGVLASSVDQLVYRTRACAASRQWAFGAAKETFDPQIGVLRCRKLLSACDAVLCVTRGAEATLASWGRCGFLPGWDERTHAACVVGMGRLLSSCGLPASTLPLEDFLAAPEASLSAALAPLGVGYHGRLDHLRPQRCGMGDAGVLAGCRIRA